MRVIIAFLLGLLLAAALAAAFLVFRGRTASQQPLPPPPTLAATAPAAPPGAATPTLAATTSAPQQPAQPGGAFAGTWEGFLEGDQGSRAPTTLTLTQDGAAVSGTIALGDGLYLDAGSCGGSQVPAGTQAAAGTVDPANPLHLEAQAVTAVQGVSVAIQLSADAAADGQSLSAQAMIDLPFLCGRDPVIRGVLGRVGQ